MFASAKISRLAIAAFALVLVAGCAEQSAPAPKVANAAPVFTPELAGAWYQIYFDSNKIELDERSRLIVSNVARVVANAGPTRVTVIGKTDSVGGQSDNLALSRKRADHVRNALIAAGVPSGTIDTSWTGENQQQVATLDDAAERRNRVVDVTVVKTTR